MARRNKRANRDRPGPAGFLVVDKPAGMTSHDVVDAAREWFGIRRIGHLGTLDPQATGVLPLAIRSATKLVSFLQQANKSYVGTVRLGAVTDTLDGEGEILERYEGELPDEATVVAALKRFEGDIEQIPPMYSAVKKDGVPLHRLARRGEEVEREPKKVHVERIELTGFTPPDLEIEVDCGAGTYVRTLAHDLGQVLGCGGYLASLRRTRSLPFDISDAKPMEAYEQAAKEGRIDELLVRPEVVLGYPVIELAPPGVERVLHGGEISPGTLRQARPGTRVSALAPDGRLIAVLELRADRQLWPLRVIPA
jgi:tRNA pseudouridine55 synthase